MGGNGSDAFDLSHGIILLLPCFSLFDHVVEFSFDFLDLLFDHGDGLIDIVLYGCAVGMSASILFRAEHVDKLSSACDEVLHDDSLGVGKCTNFRVHGLSVLGEDASINGIGFGELASGPGEASHLKWIDDDDGQVGGGEFGDDGSFIVAGCFNDDGLKVF